MALDYVRAAARPYSLEVGLAADRNLGGCFVLDVSCYNEVGLDSSLEYVNAQVDHYLLDVHDRIAPVTTLYVIGNWTLTSKQAGKDDLQQPHCNDDVGVYIRSEQEICLIRF